MNELTRLLVTNHIEQYFTNTFFKSSIDYFVATLPHIIEGFSKQAVVAELDFKVRFEEALKRPMKIVVDPNLFNLEGIKNVPDEKK